MATPAEPPAIMTALSESAAGSCPAGVSDFLTISYTTKSARQGDSVSLGAQRMQTIVREEDIGGGARARRERRTGCAAGAVASNGRAGAAVDALEAALLVQLGDGVHRAAVELLAALALHLFARAEGERQPTCADDALDELEVEPERRRRRTCSRTLTRSTGAATRVVGMAEKKPAAASSPYERTEDGRFGVMA